MAEKKKVAKKKPSKAKVEKVIAANPKQDVIAVKPKPVLKTEPDGYTLASANFDEVFRLLEHARKCHLAAKVYARGEARPQGFKAHWQTACDARRRADSLDPAHLAPAWKADEGFAGKDTHSTLMVFYGSVGCV